METGNKRIFDRVLALFNGDKPWVNWATNEPDLSAHSCASAVVLIMIDKIRKIFVDSASIAAIDAEISALGSRIIEKQKERQRLVAAMQPFEPLILGEAGGLVAISDEDIEQLLGDGKIIREQTKQSGVNL
jgi:hypothetical protein